jgi:hypothetical protein
MASKVNFHISKSEAAYAEHYLYGVIAAGLAVHQVSPHDSFKVLMTKAIVAGLIVPIIARINPKSLVNQIDAVTGLSATVTAPLVDAAIADANKLVAAESTK